MELFYGSFKHQRGFIASCAQCSPVSTSIHTHNCSTSWLLRLWRRRQWLMSPLLSLTPIRLKIPILAKYTAKHWSLSGASKIIFGTEIQADPTFHSLLTRKLQTPFKLNVDFRYHSRDCFYLYKYSTNINMSCILAKGVADVSLKWYKTDKCNINYGTHLHAHIGRTHGASSVSCHMSFLPTVPVWAHKLSDVSTWSLMPSSWVDVEGANGCGAWPEDIRKEVGQRERKEGDVHSKPQVWRLWSFLTADILTW